MNTSAAGINLIKKFEGVRLVAYKCLATEQYYTIGYGHYGADVTAGMVITQAQAEALLRQDLIKYEAKVQKYDSTYQWKQAEFDALVSFAYNVGSIDGLTNKGLQSREQISEKFLSYTKSGGKQIAGLVTRRKAEKELFDSAQDAEQQKDTSLYPTVKKGSRGEYVKVLQSALNYKGIRGSSLKVDGVFGTLTELCLLEFQGMNDLTKDGICGPKTWVKLMN